MKTQFITPEQIIQYNNNSDYGIIANKAPDYAEVIVNFFDHCNMRCVFCPQDHEDRTGTSWREIAAKVDPVSRFINLNPRQEVHMHMMGGELFQDEFIDKGFLTFYGDFMLMVKEKCPTKKIVFNFITNLVFDQIHRVRKFCELYDLEIAVSYDPIGRFNPSQFKLFKANIDIMQDYIRMISLTMTKQSMQKIIEGDPYFDYLYENFDCDWDHLLPGSDKLKPMMPAESDLYAFYKLLVDKYPDCINIKSFTEQSNGKTNKTHCTRGNNFTIFSDGSVPKGCSGAVILKNAKTEDLGGPKIIHNFINERNCLECEYYKSCTFRCFIHNEYKDMVRDLDGCVYKKVFDYVKEKN